MSAQEERIQIGTKHYPVLITPDPVDGGYVAECPELPGCFSQGETLAEARRNIKDAIQDWLDEAESQRLRA